MMREDLPQYQSVDAIIIEVQKACSRIPELYSLTCCLEVSFNYAVDVAEKDMHTLCFFAHGPSTEENLDLFIDIHQEMLTRFVRVEHPVLPNFYISMEWHGV